MYLILINGVQYMSLIFSVKTKWFKVLDEKKKIESNVKVAYKFCILWSVANRM